MLTVKKSRTESCNARSRQEVGNLSPGQLNNTILWPAMLLPHHNKLTWQHWRQKRKLEQQLVWKNCTNQISSIRPSRVYSRLNWFLLLILQK